MGIVYIILSCVIGYQTNWLIGLFFVVSTWIFSFLVGLLNIKLFLKNGTPRDVENLEIAGYAKNIVLFFYLVNVIISNYQNEAIFPLNLF
jgi:hypothetical protein